MTLLSIAGYQGLSVVDFPGWTSLLYQKLKGINTPACIIYLMKEANIRLSSRKFELFEFYHRSPLQ
jgi:hypothetical protein